MLEGEQYEKKYIRDVVLAIRRQEGVGGCLMIICIEIMLL